MIQQYFWNKKLESAQRDGLKVWKSLPDIAHAGLVF